MSKPAHKIDDGLNPEDPGNEGGGKPIAPQSNDIAKEKIRKAFAKIDDLKKKRTSSNESLTAERAKLVELGFGLDAQKVVASYMKLNEKDKRFFDQQVAIMRDALGDPVQHEMELGA